MHALLSMSHVVIYHSRMRCNDGAVDSQGRYWVGTMNDPKVKDPSDEGILFRLDPDKSLHRMIEGVSIPNGMSWSSDDRVMYFTDSPSKNIYKYDFDAVSGIISNRQIFFHLEEEDAVPDGFAVDFEECFWVALAGGGKVLRISPQGQVIAQIVLPTRMIACPAFVGEDLYITTAEEEDPDKYPDSIQYAGSLFKVSVGVAGKPPLKWSRI